MSVAAIVVCWFSNCTRDGGHATQDAGFLKPAEKLAFGTKDGGTVLLPWEPQKRAYSFIQLIAHPHEYAGARVQLYGFLRMGKEDAMHGGGDGYLYMTKGRGPEALKIRLGTCRFVQTDAGSNTRYVTWDDALVHVGYEGGYVWIEGFVEAPNEYSAAAGNFGAVCGITTISPVPRPKERDSSTGDPQPPGLR